MVITNLIIIFRRTLWWFYLFYFLKEKIVCRQKYKISIFLKTSYNILCKLAEWMKLFCICHTY